MRGRTATRIGTLMTVAGFAAVLLATASTASANTYVADRLADDSVSVTPCMPVPVASSCTLRQAIDKAAANPGTDTVQLVAGIYNQVLAETGADDNTGGDYDYGPGGPLTIIGAGQGVSSIDRSGGGDRLFEFAGTDSVTLSQMSIINGWTYNPAVDGANGGAIEARIGAPGSLTLNDVTIRMGFASGDGGGIYSSSNQLVLNRVTISDNYAGSGDVGGASTGSGGGIAIEDAGAAVSAEVNASTLNGNRTLDEVPGTLPTADGAGIFVDGDSAAPDPTVTITNSTLDSNLAHGYGGGVANSDGATVNLVNTTVSRNSANADNDPNTDGGGAERGGGLQNGIALFDLKNSLIVLNTVGTGGLNPDCNSSQGLPAFGLTSGGGNLLSNASGCGGFPAASGDAVTANPLIGPLAANGGPTKTVALLAGSPAIDHSSGCPATDQRGTSRPQGVACDTGAFELQCTVPSALPGCPALPLPPAASKCPKGKKLVTVKKKGKKKKKCVKKKKKRKKK